MPGVFYDRMGEMKLAAGLWTRDELKWDIHPVKHLPVSILILTGYVVMNKELPEKYGECSLLVYKEQVMGTGTTYREAVEDAENKLPPKPRQSRQCITVWRIEIPL